MSMLLCILALTATSDVVEERALSKLGSVTPTVQALWLDRWDLRGSPGGAVTVTHYVTESLAIDYVSAAGFYTFDLPAAVQLAKDTGFVVDRGRPLALVTTGLRYAFAYAKALVENSRTVLHFAPELALHLGAMINTRGAAPEADLGLGVRLQVSGGFVVLVEYRLLLTLEAGRAVFGGMPMLGVGWMF